MKLKVIYLKVNFWNVEILDLNICNKFSLKIISFTVMKSKLNPTRAKLIPSWIKINTIWNIIFLNFLVVGSNLKKYFSPWNIIIQKIFSFLVFCFRKKCHKKILEVFQDNWFVIILLFLFWDWIFTSKIFLWN